MGDETKKNKGTGMFGGQSFWSLLTGGRSPDLSKWKDYEEYFAENFPFPNKDDYTSPIFPGGFDEEGYNEALLEYYKNFPMY